MRFLIEFDGPLANVLDHHYATYRCVAQKLGWSRVDQATYRRLTRTKGRQANILPGAKPTKIEQYYEHFAVLVEEDDGVRNLVARDGLGDVLRRVTHRGTCVLVSLGANLPGRQAVLQAAGLDSHFSEAAALAADPRRRPMELKALSDNDPRAIVVGASDSLLRPAREAGLFTIGIANGVCTAPRLHAAGADVVYRSLEELADALVQGGSDLVAAGLLPGA